MDGMEGPLGGGRRKSNYHHGALRAALLEAAEEELAERGIEGFTLRGVAKRAGVSHAAPAHHFRDTSDMLTALATIGMERFCRAMEKTQAEPHASPRDRFIASGVTYVEFALANPTLFHLMFGSRRPDFESPGFVQHSSTAFQNLVDGIAAIRGGAPLEVRAGRMDIAAAWALVHGIATLMIARRLKFLAGDLAENRTETIREMVSRIALLADENGGTAPRDATTSAD
jgi:AcrR family transcriptional regulator